ncbi:MAG TPA: hypothetical protein VFO16_00355 [Pseudonocardiaceae bacterium]|nr:hypothetical protein [Pseudonocardiaceae bacterium]
MSTTPQRPGCSRVVPIETYQSCAVRSANSATRTTALLNAMREDLVDLRSRMGSLEQKADTGFIEMRGKLDATAAGLDQIAGMLTTLMGRPG